MKSMKWLAAKLSLMAVGLLLMAGLPVAAQDRPQASTPIEPAMATNIVDFLKLHPISPEAEAAIVHEIPPFEFIIIDGLKYESKDIALFNGHRLGFASGIDGQEYAFTSVERLGRFLDERHARIGQSDARDSLQRTLESWGGSRVCEDAWFGGDALILTVNQGSPDFSWLRNEISSLENDPGNETYLFDYVDYGGDYRVFDAAGGSPYYYYWQLATYGWNDRAESGICFPK